MMELIFAYEQSKARWGSTIIRGFNIAKHLNVPIVEINQIKDVRNKKIIFLKIGNYAKLLDIAKKNYTIIDMVDFRNLDQLKYFNNFNSAIFTSKQQSEYYNKFFKNPEDSKVIYHHWDERLSNINTNDKKISISYFGIVEKCYLYNYFNDISYYNVTEFKGDFKPNCKNINFQASLQYYQHYNVHYIVKPQEQENLIQPMTKLSNASALGCPVICYRNNQYEELLSKDYPYFINNISESDVRNIILKLKETHHDSEWVLSKSIMNNVKEKTSLNNILKQYSNI